MKKKDIEYFDNIEQIIEENLEVTQISKLQDFPYSTLSELEQVYSEGKLLISVNFNGDDFKTCGTNSQRLLNSIFVLTPMLIIVADIVLAIILKKWLILLGIVSVLTAAIASSPFNSKRNLVFLIGIILLLANIFFWNNRDWSIVIGSFVVSMICSLLTRSLHYKIVKERMFRSEVFFCYLFQKGTLNLQEKMTGSFILPKTQSNSKK